MPTFCEEIRVVLLAVCVFPVPQHSYDPVALFQRRAALICVFAIPVLLTAARAFKEHPHYFRYLSHSKPSASIGKPVAQSGSWHITSSISAREPSPLRTSQMISSWIVATTQ